MKINKFTSILALLLATIVSYFLSSYQAGGNKLVLGIGSFIGLFISSTATIAISFEYDRTTTLTRITSALFFVLYLVTQIVFASVTFALPTYTLVNGSAIILLLLVIYGIVKSKH